MKDHIIIGTAGHIDHGKTTLIKALTGANTDRLQEEKKRGISIDLGFTGFTIEGQKAGIIDVPGHEKFLKNMLAGIAGMDMVLLVVSAEEGVMPQTKEHLDILSLIGLKRGLVVLTKADKVDEEFLLLVEEDIEELLRGTFLENAPRVAVDSISGRGIEKLKAQIYSIMQTVEERPYASHGRLFVDRVFSIKGFGTVVTGTLVEGELSVDLPVWIMPQKISTRIRSLQVHNQAVQKAFAGQRVAINLASIALDQVQRGDILTSESNSPISMIIDSKVKMLPGSGKDLEHWDRIRLYHGAREVLGRAVPLQDTVLTQGQEGFVQFRLEEPVSFQVGDPLVIRLYSPMLTLGGGSVIDPCPSKHTSHTKGVVERLSIVSQGTPEQKIESFLLSKPEIFSLKEIAEHISETEISTQEWMDHLVEKQKVIPIHKHYLHSKYYQQLSKDIQQAIASYHKLYPFRKGIPKEEVRTKASVLLKPKDFDWVVERLSATEKIDSDGSQLFDPNFSIEFTGDALKIRQQFEEAYQGNLMPLQTEKILANDPLRLEIYRYLLGDHLVRIHEDITYERETWQAIESAVRAYLEKNTRINLKSMKEIPLFEGVSRKYLIAILDYFDKMRITRKEGDDRILVR